LKGLREAQQVKYDPSTHRPSISTNKTQSIISSRYYYYFFFQEPISVANAQNFAQKIGAITCKPEESGL
jgi:hypothetical protein